MKHSMLLAVPLALATYVACAADELTIVGWNEWGIPKFSVERYRDAREAGFTHLVQRMEGTSQKTVDRIVHALDCAKAAGIKLLVKGEILMEAPEKIVPVIRNHPALAMYLVKDEPMSSEFPKVGKAMCRIKEMDPKHPCYVNWFGIMCMPDGSQHWCTLDDYPEYARQSRAAMPLELVSFDYYPVKEKDGAVIISSKWFGALEFMRKYSTAEKLPFWAFALSTSHRNGTYATYPVPTIEHLKLQHYANLAHGAQGLQYFTYWMPPYEEKACWKSGPVTWEGEHTFMYERVREVNMELQARADVFVGSRVVDIGHTGELPFGTKRIDAMPGFVKSFDCADRPALLSHLKKGNREFLVVVNRTLKDELAFNARFADGTKLVRKDGTRGTATMKDGEFRVEPGGAAIFEWTDKGNKE